jgi:aryl-alcohol dehydrogenase-like predicted oxidoreductase
MATGTVNPVRLGMTDLEVLPIAFGTWQLGGEWGEFDEEEGIAAVLEEGKIRHVGVSNYVASQIEEFARARPVETVQPAYHLFRRDIEAELLPYAREHDIGS